MRIGGDTILRKCGWRDLITMLDGFRVHGLPTMIGAAALVAWVLWPLQAGATLVVRPGGTTVYDTVNNVSWLASADLAATNRFGLAVCGGSGTQPCVNQSGSISYEPAAWVQAMNGAGYLGHTNWQPPINPPIDHACGKNGPNGDSRLLGQRAGFAVQRIGPLLAEKVAAKVLLGLCPTLQKPARQRLCPLARLSARGYNS